MLEMVDAVALRPLLLPAGQVAEGEAFITTAAHVTQLIDMGLAKAAPAKGGKKAEAAKD